jgi:hypothetical protein
VALPEQQRDRQAKELMAAIPRSAPSHQMVVVAAAVQPRVTSPEKTVDQVVAVVALVV